MNPLQILNPVRLFPLLAIILGIATAAPYGPDGRATRWTQPDGTVISLRVFGDDYYARTETTDGYTVLRNADDNAYHYARLSADGNSLEATGPVVGQPVPAGLPKHLDLALEKIDRISEQKRAAKDGGRRQRWNERVQAVKKVRQAAGAGLRGAPDAAAMIKAAPLTGDKVGLTILVQFPNDAKTPAADPVNFPTNRNKIIRYCNTPGYNEDGNTGSVRDYYFDQSRGKLTYTQKVTPIVTLPRSRSYYNFSDYPKNKKVREDSGESGRLLLTDAIKVLKDLGYNFSGLTLDPESRVLATNIFFAGEDSGVFAEGLWPHQSTLFPSVNAGTSANPIIIGNYQITNIPDARPVIGTFCHENGHLICDYPDIYSLRGEGVGSHCLMGSGNYLNNGKTPSPINAYFKDIVGWENVTELAPREYAIKTLPTTGNVSIRIRKPGLDTEFFMVENRGAGDKWARYSEDAGIAIWHVDETIDFGNFYGRPRYSVSLEQADGRNDLEDGGNRGDDGDYFDIEDGDFTDTTSPNARWWDATPSGIDIRVVSAVGSSTNVTFGEVPENTIIVDAPRGRRTIAAGSTYPVTWRANISGGVKIDLYKAGVFLTTLSPEERNDGLFEWRVPPSLKPASDYTIRIGAISNPVAIGESSSGVFAIKNGTFPVGGKIPVGWFKPAGTQGKWKVTSKNAFEGKHSLFSGSLGDRQTSAIAYRGNFKAGRVSFAIRVSTEQDFDLASFSIDGVSKEIGSGKSKKTLSGNLGWRTFSFPVKAGTHIFRWSYKKDASYAGWRDSVWIDDVSFPETTEEIAVSSPGSGILTSGKSSLVFPDTFVGSSSKPLELIIKNTGKATLTNITVSRYGTNLSEFSVSAPPKNTLAPGKTMTLDVVFKPGSEKPRKAGVIIHSSDADEASFAVALEGTGLGVPEIAVKSSSGKALVDDKGSVDLGIQFIGSTGDTETFTISNTGKGDLTGLQLGISGPARSDFSLGRLGATSLSPGESTTFDVTFEPTARDERNAVVGISSNDRKTGVFDINLVGIGAPVFTDETVAAASGRTSSRLAISSFGQDPATPGVSGVEVVQGLKYLSLTITRVAGTAVGTVEVSPNLLDWYSGANHTTILLDDRTTLKVRDNTPVTQDAKRYIRVR